MAEHDSDREDREDREGPDGHVPQEQSVPFDEDAAWAAIVEGYGEEPPDPPGAKPFKSIEDLALLEPETNGPKTNGPETNDPETNDPGTNGGDRTDKPAGEPDKPAPAKPLGGSVAFAPGVGPRDHSLAEPAEDDLGGDDEGHFVPPEPPPLPQGDVTARFAWLGVLGGPLLLLVAILLGWDMTWWLTTVCIGGFLGGFGTLVTRMRTDDDEDDDPGRGAVV